jgi:hypothetical protein
MIHFWTLYYCLVFCGIYPENAVGLVFGIIWGMIINLGQILIIQPILLLLVRNMMMCCKLAGLEILFMACNL